MLRTLQQRKERGFTIIEVLIVLAIAGLIMLVVFLAVPALQRNSRNTQYRNEANRLISSYSEISANNGGAVLGNNGAPGTSTSDTTANNAANDADKVYEAANTKNVTTLVVETNAGTTLPTLSGINGQTITRNVIRTGSKCPTTMPAPAAAPTVAVPVGSTRQLAILFAVETSANGVFQLQCIES